MVREFFVLSSFLLVGGCAFGEAVFLRQNELGQQLASRIMIAEEKNIGEAKRLYPLEDELNRRCESVQRAASRQMSGETLSLWESIQVFFSLAECEEASKRIETQLSKK